jgi:hypothetical protein
MPEIEGPKKEPFFAPYGLLRLGLWIVGVIVVTLIGSVVWLITDTAMSGLRSFLGW